MSFTVLTLPVESKPAFRETAPRARMSEYSGYTEYNGARDAWKSLLWPEGGRCEVEGASRTGTAWFEVGAAVLTGVGLEVGRAGVMDAGSKAAAGARWLSEGTAVGAMGAFCEIGGSVKVSASGEAGEFTAIALNG